MGDTQDPAYTARLTRLGSARWKRWLGAQALYGWKLRRLDPGFVLDLGCGLGRNLANLEGHGVGVDHNPHSVVAARQRGFAAFLPEEFAASTYAHPERFDSLLLSHVAEHMSFDEAVTLIRRYLPYVRATGKVILITPQEAGFASDETHVEFMDFDKLARLALAAGRRPVFRSSFPFPRLAGRVFRYNEFILVAGPS